MSEWLTQALMVLLVGMTLGYAYSNNKVNHEINNRLDVVVTGCFDG